jgi:hypothetical protein
MTFVFTFSILNFKFSPCRVLSTVALAKADALMALWLKNPFNQRNPMNWSLSAVALAKADALVVNK